MLRHSRFIFSTPSSSSSAAAAAVAASSSLSKLSSSPPRRRHTKILIWGSFGGSSLTSKRSSPPTELILDSLPPRNELPSDWHFCAVAAGSRHIALLTTEGHLVLVGSNKHGEIGRDTKETVSEDEPQYFDFDWQDPELEAPNALACGCNYTIAYRRNKGRAPRAIVVGHNNAGQLGLGHKELLEHRDGIAEWRPFAPWFDSPQEQARRRKLKEQQQQQQQQVAGKEKVQGKEEQQQEDFENKPEQAKIENIECGYNHTMIFLSDGRVLACGTNQWGELGFGRNVTNSPLQPETVKFFDQQMFLRSKEGQEMRDLGEKENTRQMKERVEKEQQQQQKESEEEEEEGKNSLLEAEGKKSKTKHNKSKIIKNKDKKTNKKKVVDIEPHCSLGNSFSLYCSPEGRVYGWGSAGRGQLPFAAQEPIALPLTRDSRPLLLRIRNVSAGADHAVFVSTKNDVYLRGSLPDVGIIDATGAMREISLGQAKAPFQYLVSHGCSTLLVDSEGDLFGLGANSEGQLGKWSDDDKPVSYSEIESSSSSEFSSSDSSGENEKSGESEETKKVEEEEEKVGKEKKPAATKEELEKQERAKIIANKPEGFAVQISGKEDNPFKLENLGLQDSEAIPSPVVAVNYLRRVGLQRKNNNKNGNENVDDKKKASTIMTTAKDGFLKWRDRISMGSGFTVMLDPNDEYEVVGDEKNVAVEPIYLPSRSRRKERPTKKLSLFN